ncbi:hypothetical protein NZD85_06015 [Empedobacter stercoris]|uniref:exodeoxyribonuclease X C-terminal domain-containing protein n=1 Tax=Empedobacter stercoris TaxID=1628248 RepID=UPI0021AE4310|nr:hypothetical protein [Empedobacter stercoris]UWX68154.1 hypothetical protein NZD85_06015 [Empedobacter stercoris]
MRELKLYTENTILDFGKYKRSTIKYVLDSNPEYLKWCIENVSWFIIGEDLFAPIFKTHYEMELLHAMLNETKQPTFAEVISGFKKINDSKFKELEILKNQNYEDDDYFDDDYYDDWINDMQDNWLSYAAGTDDPETMNDVYWNLD